MKIIVDAFGGDHAPLAVIEGCRQAVDELGQRSCSPVMRRRSVRLLLRRRSPWTVWRLSMRRR